MKIAVHAGHNAPGLVGCGAVAVVDESAEARKICSYVVSQLQAMGHQVVDVTVNDGKSQKDVLVKLKKKINALHADLSISIHLNCGANDREGNGRSTGTEVLVYSEKTKALPYARAIVSEFAAVGFRNRMVKYRKDLAVLKGTNCPSLLVECYFADDMDDVILARKLGYAGLANCIVTGITGKNVLKPQPVPVVPTSGAKYKVQCGSFTNKASANELKTKLKTVGFDCFIVED